MGWNPLYNEVYGYVRKTLDNRAKNVLKGGIWSSKKAAYCYIEAVCDDASKNAGTPIARIGHVEDYIGGVGQLYSNPEKVSDVNTSFFKDATIKSAVKTQVADQSAKYGRKYYPQIPIVKDVSITNQGQMGSMQKANVSITIPDPRLIDSYEELFLRPGREIKIKYGWNVSAENDPSSNCADSDIFRGIIYNSSWSVNDQLGYDCSFDAVGEGFFSINAPSTVRSKTGPKYGNEEFQSAKIDLKTQLEGDMNELPNPPGNTYIEAKKPYDNKTQKKMVYYVADMITSEVDTTEGGLLTDQSNTRVTDVSQIKVTNKTTNKMYFITLNSLIEWLNIKVLGYFNNRGFQIEKKGEDGTVIKVGDKKTVIFSSDLEAQIQDRNPFNDTTLNTTCENRKDKEYLATAEKPYSAGVYVRNLKSANPTKVLLPGEFHSNYYGKHWYSKSGPIKARYTNDSKNGPYGPKGCRLVNLGEILLSTDVIIEEYSKMIENSVDSPVEQSIGNFLKALFDVIANETGKLHELTLISREDYAEDKDFTAITVTVMDQNFQGCDSIKPYIFTPRVHSSIMRNISISSKLPSATQTAMYAGGRSAISENISSGESFSNLQNRYFKVCGTTENPPPPDAPVEGEEQEEIKWEQREKAIGRAISENGINDMYCQEFRNVMRRLKTNPADFPESYKGLEGVKGSWLNRTLYPVDVSITLDGTAGFRFGNVVSTDWLPAKYRYNEGGKEKLLMLFIILEVSHKISGFDWETSLKLQCRPEMNP